MPLTVYSKLFAYELTKRCASDSPERLAGALVDAQVDLNPHQVEDVLFTVVVPLTPIADDATPQVEAPVEAPVKAPVGALSADQLETASVPSLSQVCPKSVPREVAKLVLLAAETSADLQTLMEKAGHSNRTRFRNAILKPLIDAGLLGLTVPDKPRSSKQKYMLTDKGREALHPRTGVK